ncbi:hypothetical protein AAEO56_09040 [Flavobacterium sp. DGU11]|uniref:Uncharacterized protein n=1 Tax=Flavobacterium arundinis TaxID=3139143 RepID=A0ABU9HXF6_9FLAO
MEASKDLFLFKGKIFTAIYTITVIEDGNEFVQDNTLLFECSDGTFLQILVDHILESHELLTLDKIVIKGDYEMQNCKIITNVFKNLPGVAVDRIYNYFQGKYYHFGSKFIDPDGQYIFGICYGFDELVLLDEMDFKDMLSKYQGCQMMSL